MDICTVALSFSLAAMPMLGEVVAHQPELVRRSVRVEFAKGTCTGVLVDARTVRTAGHCFADGGRFMGVTTFARGKITARFQTDWSSPPSWAREPRAWDDIAEIKADRNIADVTPVEVVDPSMIAPGTKILTGGFGRGREAFRLLPLELAAGRDWKLFWYRTTFAGWSSEFLKARVGDSGGGAWIVRDGKLALVGLLTRRVTNPERLGAGFAIQHLPR